MKLKVRDIMTTELKSISQDMNAKKALEVLIKSGASGLIVIDKDGRLAGVFTEREILKAALPSYVSDIGTFVYSKDLEAQIKRLTRLEKISVKDLMREHVSCVDEETTLVEVAQLMLVRNERRLIVVKDNKPVGVVTRFDVVKAYAKELGVI